MFFLKGAWVDLEVSPAPIQKGPLMREASEAPRPAIPWTFEVRGYLTHLSCRLGL